MKKFLSLLLSAAMIIAPVTQAFADEVELQDVTVIEEERLAEDAGTVIIEEDSEFNYSEVIDGYEIALHAQAGVFPVGSSVTIEKTEDDNNSIALIEESLSENESVKKSVKFDITFKNPAGEVVEPENGLVNVAINPSEAFTELAEGASVAVYHITDSNVVEKIDSVIAEDGVVFDAASFSSYSITIIETAGADKKGPELKGLSIRGNKTSVVLGDEDYDDGDDEDTQYMKSSRVDFHVDITDDLSGVSYADFYFENENGDTATLNYYPSESEKYSSMYFDKPGTYEIKRVYMSDQCANYVYMYRDGNYSGINVVDMPEFVKNIKITVTSKKDFIANISSASMVKNGDKIETTVVLEGADAEYVDQVIVNIIPKYLYDRVPEMARQYTREVYLNRDYEVTDKVVFKDSGVISSYYEYPEGSNSCDYIVYSVEISCYPVAKSFSRANNLLPDVLKNIVINIPTAKHSSRNNDTRISVSNIMFENNSPITASDKPIDILISGKFTSTEGHEINYISMYFTNSSNKGSYKSIGLSFHDIVVKEDGSFTAKATFKPFVSAGVYSIDSVYLGGKKKSSDGNYYTEFITRDYDVESTDAATSMPEEMKKLSITIKDDQGGKWVSDSNGWRYLGKDGKYYTGRKIIDGALFIFADNGYLKKGWTKDSDKWYYMTSNGAVSGWYKENGKWYLFTADKEDPYMYAGTYYTDENGKRYYLKPTGELNVGWTEVSYSNKKAWIYSDASGVVATGWKQIGNVWYYFDVEGYFYAQMATGWKLINNAYYYFGTNGAMVSSKWVGNYYLKANGKMAVNEWIDNKYYVDANGKWDPSKKPGQTAVTTGGWKKSANGWWYQYSDGSYPKNAWAKIDGKWYHFNASGYMQTGWISLGGKWYYLNSNGSMATGWVKVGGSYYYMYADGHMASNEWIGKYHVNASGVWDQSK